MVFAAGAMLAVADSSMRDRVAAVSSVSGGSIASAATIGAFGEPSALKPDPMAERTSLIAKISQSGTIHIENSLKSIWLPVIALAAIPIWLFIFPEPGIYIPDPVLGTGTANWAGRYLPAMVPLLLSAIAFYFAVAIMTNWYSVQAVVEGLVGRTLGRGNPGRGMTLSEIGDAERLNRIFCTTDLSTGAHVYLTPRGVLAPGRGGEHSNVYLADVVAASACFPGFRPVGFTQHEVGLSGPPPDPTTVPRLHRHAGRLAIGFVGFLGIALALGTVLDRISNAYVVLDPGPVGLLEAVILVSTGIVLADISAWILRPRDDLLLVDGGVCDNLGAAFAVLTNDTAYATLPAVAGATSPGLLLLVIDASKPVNVPDVRSARLDELIPRRFRGAQRSIVKLLGRANAAARSHAIRVLLDGDGPIIGDLVSISDVPSLSAADALALQRAGVVAEDWWSGVVANRTKVTPTTLGALDHVTVSSLLLQSYRLTQNRLESRGIALTRERTVEEIVELASPWSPLGPEMTLREMRRPARSGTVRERLSGWWVNHSGPAPARRREFYRELSTVSGPYERLDRRRLWVALACTLIWSILATVLLLPMRWA
ncbi:MAG: hypothetical protein ACRDJC_00090 [Thermomicrobiales bacterium]